MILTNLATQSLPLLRASPASVTLPDAESNVYLAAATKQCLAAAKAASTGRRCLSEVVETVVATAAAIKPVHVTS